MASLVLGAVGSAVGANTFLGAGLGAALGRGAGGLIDNTLFGSSVHREGRRLEELSVQTSTYGESIPLIYGSARLAGNVIWARPLKEVATTTESGGKGGGATQSSTQFSYFASLAIAICEGEVDSVERIWADAAQLDLSQGTYRIYYGSEDQLPDALIQSFEGADFTPAYRGLAYLVVEDFPLAAFGNRIPNFTFEVKRKLLPNEINEVPLEHHLKSMIMIPGSGEFVYDTLVQAKQSGEQAGDEFAQTGFDARINMHNNQGKANALVAVDQLLETCPNLEWVGLVVTWFGDDMDAGNCTLKPAVEYKGDARTTPDTWGVAGYTRGTAPLMTLIDGVPRYGGTPSDTALIRTIDELKSRGIKVMLYPLFFMDVAEKPWRGRVTGGSLDVADFFTKTHGYNEFISHYASLTKNKVDAFVIGSEMIGLTKVTDGVGTFPAVNELVNLAAYVKGVMGAGTTLTYAADWSEYHHTQGGWYNLDPLWASPNIDVIGIDAYFPLTDGSADSISLQDAVDGWTRGEGYDWYYSDVERTVQTPLTPEFAWKNIDYWWKNTHTNPDSIATAWVPESKPIWFTEFGFPSVDGASNQPNVFYDPSSSESFFPHFSQGRIDPAAQRQGLLATELAWAGSTMVPNRFVWTWDARPFPYWPDLRSVWADGDLWKTGHWVNGKLGVSGLAAIILELCQQVGLDSSQVDVSRLQGTVEGFLVTRQQPVREAIESLMGAYFFDVVESDGRVKFVPRGGSEQLTISQDNLLPGDAMNQRSLLNITRMQEVELPQQVSVIYLNRSSHYQTGHQIAQRIHVDSQEKATLNFPIVMGQGQAQQVAEISLHTAWAGRTQFAFELPPRYLALEPSDVITLQMDGISHSVRITQTTLGEGYGIQLRAILEEAATYDAYAELETMEEPVLPVLIPATKLKLLDIALLPGDDVMQASLRVAMGAQGEDWSGALLYRSSDEGQSWRSGLSTDEPAICGTMLSLPASDTSIATLDNRSEMAVNLVGSGTLASTTQSALLNGANAALVGNEIIQFASAELIAAGKYKLTGLLRGRLGTEQAMAAHTIGERFVLLDERVLKDSDSSALIGLPRDYRSVTLGSTLGQVESVSFTHSGVGLKPYAPVHVKGIRDASGNLLIEWKRRSRAETNWRDLVDIPLNETSEHYEIDVLDGTDVVRILTRSTPQATYSEADQIVDFGAAQTSISLRIYQLSAAIGRGYATTLTL
ncbi:MAG: glycoside hydrolase TIM-barrel-like domain-containing protein [Rickettsiales bacterium]|nr:glycoside hydrolase TIM-barrel-like domain-containing protein [Rickettsiales bacterium]